ncbi:peptidase S41 [Stenotrophomonas humi]|uniref:Peptidase S41 n=1 Tax=Stenotrophomonas humi TaxID=405444 RepID=A0A0R0C2U9_9GAMM|nr:S41 family peptidase [Stenotrophomonas humi]KRG64207.1 peptidase S41 [Stenotrophomonas humi]
MRVARLAAALLLALSPAMTLAQSASDKVPTADDPDAKESVTSRVPLDEIRRFVAVYNAVRAAYVDPVDDKQLMQSAVRGLLLELDPHSTYFDKEDAQAFDEQATGAYEGIGVELLQQDNVLKVVSPIDDTPAARAGIRAGDLIVAIDGKPISAIEAMEPLRGVAGSKVVLTIERGDGKPFDVTVVRETIRVTSVRSKMLEPGYAYVRISTFQADTAADFQKHLNQLQAQSGGRLKGLVLDLRSNPGGLLTAAVQVADDLLDKGGIVSTRGRISISDAKFDATPGDLMKGAPVMVLVDAGSASASEVLAGALRDNQRARVIGSRTFGKGSVQTVLPLDNGDSVKLTTARYYTPSGRSIQATGILPDVELAPEPSDVNKDVPASLVDYSEASLPGHLRGDDEATASKAGVVLSGEGPVQSALRELKQPGSVASVAKAKPATAAAPAAAATAHSAAARTEPAKPEAAAPAAAKPGPITPEPSPAPAKADSPKPPVDDGK